MPRPKKYRIIRGCPPYHIFKPAGLPVRSIEYVALPHEGYEAIRLADLEGLSQEEGAKRMGISRATFGRILENAHRKVAEALTRGKGLLIEGGNFQIPGLLAGICMENRGGSEIMMGRFGRGGQGRGGGRGKGRGRGRMWERMPQEDRFGGLPEEVSCDAISEVRRLQEEKEILERKISELVARIDELEKKKNEG